MKINFNELDLTDKLILSYVSEYDIFKYYLGSNFKLGELFKSNLRNNDDTASLNIFIKNGSLRYKDFGHSYGNCFEYVRHLYQCDYGTALKIIAKDFNIKPEITTVERPKVNTYIPEEVFEKVIIPVKRGWKKIDLEYWGKYGITIPMLVEYDIFPCNHVYLQNKPDNRFIWAVDEENNPIYCYKIDNKYKCYRPLSKDKKMKWLSTTKENDLQGMKQLPKSGKLLILASAMKEVLVLKKLGYTAIAAGGEGNNIPKKILDFLFACFKKVIILYDNDKPGLMYAKQLSNTIECSFIHIPLEHKEKNISDYVEKYGLEEGDKLMKKLL